MGSFKEIKKVSLGLPDWSLPDFGLTREIDEWSSLIFVRVFEHLKNETKLHVGYVFVCDPKFGVWAQWKMPGGHNTSKDKTPLYTAQRELYGETGVLLSLDRFNYLGKEQGSRGDHWRCIFTADMSFTDDVPWMNNNHPENEGEIQRYFSIEEFHNLILKRRFLLSHFNLLVAEGSVSPLS